MLHVGTILPSGSSLVAYWIKGRLLYVPLFSRDRFSFLSMRSQGTPSDNKTTSSTWKMYLWILLQSYATRLLRWRQKYCHSRCPHLFEIGWLAPEQQKRVLSLLRTPPLQWWLLSLLSHCLPENDRKIFSSLYRYPLTIKLSLIPSISPFALSTSHCGFQTQDCWLHCYALSDLQTEF